MVTNYVSLEFVWGKAHCCHQTKKVLPCHYYMEYYLGLYIHPCDQAKQ